MEYQKYLKYKTKYLQLKYKIESEAKYSQNKEENNMIVHARSPLQWNPPTYENEQTGGFDFTSNTGYYAFFCNGERVWDRFCGYGINR